MRKLSGEKSGRSGVMTRITRREMLGALAAGGLAGAGHLLPGCQELKTQANHLDPFPAKWFDNLYDPEQPTVISTAGLRRLSEQPLRAEPGPLTLADSYITPLERFYINDHGTAPQIDAGSYRLSVEGLVRQPLSLSIHEIHGSFEPVRQTVTLVAAGNRRSEFTGEQPVQGEAWTVAGIGNARWKGVRLSDVLREAGVHEAATHVWLEGMEVADIGGGVREPYVMSIPLSRAMRDSAGTPVILAYEMNGGALPREHGFPVRAIVPGYIDAYSVKWLGRIVVADRPAEGYFMQRMYRREIASARSEGGVIDAPVTTFPVNSAICSITAEKPLHSGETMLRGWALPSGHDPCVINYVDVSSDGGQTWRRARFISESRAYCWQLWETALPVELRMPALLVRTGDSLGASQPIAAAWNPQGYFYNAYHRVQPSVRVSPLGLENPTSL